MIDFEKLAEYVRGRRVFVQTHNYPDADALASAFGVQTLLGTFGIEASIIYVGKIDKFNTQQMIKLLGIELVPAEQADLRDEDMIILVDSQKYNSNIRDMTGDEIACIDHHQILHEPEYAFCDIREDVGACSSIVAEYLIKYDVAVSKELATALLYGIKMDTADLVRGVCELDVDMFYFLYKRSNIDLISKIQLNTMEFNDLTSYAQAIEGVRVFDNIGIARLDGYCPDALIASISDFMLSLIEIEITVVYNMRQDGAKFSMRSEVEWCNAAVVIGALLDGLGSGGGHATMAGGFVPLENIGVEFDSIIQERSLTVINGQHY